MNAHRSTAIAVGALFLIATVSFSVGGVLLDPLLDVSRLGDFSSEPARYVTGALFALVDGLAVVGIAVLLLPVLRATCRTSECMPMAYGYLGMRLMECAGIVAYALFGLLLVSVEAGSEGLGTVLIAGSEWSLLLLYLFSGIAGLLLSPLLLRSAVVPRLLGWLGVFGYGVFVVATVLDMFGAVDVVNGAGLLLLMPGALFELVLPIWLIAKGFNIRNGFGDLAAEAGDPATSGARAADDLVAAAHRR